MNKDWYCPCILPFCQRGNYCVMCGASRAEKEADLSLSMLNDEDDYIEAALAGQLGLIENHALSTASPTCMDEKTLIAKSDARRILLSEIQRFGIEPSAYLRQIIDHVLGTGTADKESDK